MMHPTAIVFDLDGTLIHSAPDLHFASNVALKAFDREPLDLATIISFIGNGVEKLVERILRATGGTNENLQRDALRIFLDVYEKNMTTLTRPYPGVVPALEAFRAQGVRLGICTNKPTGPAREICEQLDLAKYFDVIVGAEPSQPKKPDPASLMRSIEVLGCPKNEALYVGDSSIDYHTAINGAVTFRLFAGGYLNEPLPNLSGADKFDDWSVHGILTK
ncbi:MAG: phosphoglycolate phosphatase [Aliishimia sp.]